LFEEFYESQCFVQNLHRDCPDIDIRCFELGGALQYGLHSCNRALLGRSMHLFRSERQTRTERQETDGRGTERHAHLSAILKYLNFRGYFLNRSQKTGMFLKIFTLF